MGKAGKHLRTPELETRRTRESLKPQNDARKAQNGSENLYARELKPPRELKM